MCSSRRVANFVEFWNDSHCCYILKLGQHKYMWYGTANKWTLAKIQLCYVWNYAGKRIKILMLVSVDNTLTLSLSVVTKTEFLLTISIQSQIDKWCEYRKISINGLSFDSVPNSPN